MPGKRLRSGDLLGPQEAVRALCARGIRVTPCGDDFQHWQIGDFLMTDADLIRFAVNRGLL
ncbi:MAG: hypothetical protein INR63_02665 [Actinomycetospora chiangmaiensis]|nr:hypothetical protein [Actinomycetospora chiangmaiensis]